MSRLVWHDLSNLHKLYLSFSGRGSIYLVGYSIEDPSLSHDRSSGKLLPPHQMCKLRKIHGNTGQTTDYVCEMHAGLHYLIGEVSPRQVVIAWGRYPDSERKDQANGKKVRSVSVLPSIHKACLPNKLSVQISFDVEMGRVQQKKIKLKYLFTQGSSFRS